MRRIILLLVGITSAGLAACANTQTITVVGPHAMRLRGTITQGPHGQTNTLQAADGQLACSGSSQSLDVTITCNDGRKGVVNLVLNTPSGLVKSGRLHLEDGTDAEIVIEILAPQDATPSAFPAQDDSTPPQIQNTASRVVIPVDGGPPVIAIPLGGNLYQPVTGGPPITATPTSP